MVAWFAETSLVAAVLAAVALIAGRWPRLSPSVRHTFWLVVLIRLAAPPLVCWPWAVPLVWARPEPPPMACETDTRLDAARGLTLQPGQAETSVLSPGAVRFVGFLDTIDIDTIGRLALPLGMAVSSVLAAVQALRIIRFRRRFRWAIPPPNWMDDEARCVARRLHVRAPEILVLPGQASPMLWFLGRPRILVPGPLVASLDRTAWRGVLAHELAHLLRRDHWVRCLVLIAGLVWWWNPIYWLARRRLDAEAELACDAWAVTIFPEGRLAYAEAILAVCRSLSSNRPPEPALGAVGPGSFLERRVSMILTHPEPARTSIWVAAGAVVIGLLSLPAWSAPPPSLPIENEVASVSNDGQAAATTIPGDQAQPPAEARASEPNRGRSNDERKKLTAESAEQRLEWSIAKVEAAASVVARNHRLNARKPGSVSAEQVAKAEAEMKMARAEFESMKATLEAAARKEQAWARANEEVALSVVARNQRLNNRKPGSVSAEEVAKAEAELERAKRDYEQATKIAKAVATTKLGEGPDESLKMKETRIRELELATRERHARLEKLQRRLDELHGLENQLRAEIEGLTREIARSNRKPQDR